ncbi:MAG: hypothetical protein KF855_06715 [Acidobacteria bacterium]|nr:hypothetical protein [Acidobacteriota bacterium]
MKLISGTLAFLVFFTGYSFSQGDASDKALCTDQTVEKIESRGIKLGMKIEDVLNIFASDEEEKEKLKRNQGGGSVRRHLGYESIMLIPQQKDKDPGGRFEGIGGYTFSFLDEKVSGFSVNYPWTRWKDSTQFAEKVAESLGLPTTDKWTGDRSTLRLTCGDYQISVTTPANSNELSVRNTQEQKIIAEREEKYNEETRKRFKP